MGCAGGQCYLNIRQSRLEQLQKQAKYSQITETSVAVGQNPFSLFLWGVTRLFTKDQDKLAAAAQTGNAALGVAGSLAAAGASRQQMKSVSSSSEEKPVSAEVRRVIRHQTRKLHRRLPEETLPHNGHPPLRGRWLTTKVCHRGRQTPRRPRRQMTMELHHRGCRGPGQQMTMELRHRGCHGPRRQMTTQVLAIYKQRGSIIPATGAKWEFFIPEMGQDFQ